MRKRGEMKKMKNSFQRRLQRRHDELRWLYMELYDNDSMFAELCDHLKSFSDERDKALKLLDDKREAETDWYKQNDMLGMMFYIDNFAGNMKGVEGKLDYLEKCNVNYIHLMPFLDTVPERSDGGYAVADFRKVQEKLGTMEDLESLTAFQRLDGNRYDYGKEAGRYPVCKDAAGRYGNQAGRFHEHERLFRHCGGQDLYHCVRPRLRRLHACYQYFGRDKRWRARRGEPVSYSGSGGSGYRTDHGSDGHGIRQDKRGQAFSGHQRRRDGNCNRRQHGFQIRHGNYAGQKY